MENPNSITGDEIDKINREKDEEIPEQSLCRVCHGETELNRPLFHPCKCDGSIKFIHQDCLQHWLRVSNKSDNRCELCGETFHFRTIYATDGKNPPRLTWFDIFSTIYPQAASALYFAIRYGFVLLVWIWITPLFINIVVQLAYSVFFYPNKLVQIFELKSLDIGLTSWFRGILCICFSTAVVGVFINAKAMLKKEYLRLKLIHMLKENRLLLIRLINLMNTDLEAIAGRMQQRHEHDPVRLGRGWSPNLHQHEDNNSNEPLIEVEEVPQSQSPAPGPVPLLEQMNFAILVEYHTAVQNAEQLQHLNQVHFGGVIEINLPELPQVIVPQILQRAPDAAVVPGLRTVQEVPVPTVQVPTVRVPTVHMNDVLLTAPTPVPALSMMQVPIPAPAPLIEEEEEKEENNNAINDQTQELALPSPLNIPHEEDIEEKEEKEGRGSDVMDVPLNAQAEAEALLQLQEQGLDDGSDTSEGSIQLHTEEEDIHMHADVADAMDDMLASIDADTIHTAHVPVPVPAEVDNQNQNNHNDNAEAGAAVPIVHNAGANALVNANAGANAGLLLLPRIIDYINLCRDVLLLMLILLVIPKYLGYLIHCPLLLNTQTHISNSINHYITSSINTTSANTANNNNNIFLTSLIATLIEDTEITSTDITDQYINMPTVMDTLSYNTTTASIIAITAAKQAVAIDNITQLCLTSIEIATGFGLLSILLLTFITYKVYKHSRTLYPLLLVALEEYAWIDKTMKISLKATTIALVYFTILPTVLGWCTCISLLRIFSMTYLDFMTLAMDFPALAMLFIWSGGILIMVLATLVMTEVEHLIKSESLLVGIFPDVLTSIRLSPDPYKHILDLPWLDLIQNMIIWTCALIISVILCFSLPARFGHLVMFRYTPLVIRYEKLSAELDSSIDMLVFHVLIPVFTENINIVNYLKMFVRNVVILGFKGLGLREFLSPLAIEENEEEEHAVMVLPVINLLDINGVNGVNGVNNNGVGINGVDAGALDTVVVEGMDLGNRGEGEELHGVPTVIVDAGTVGEEYSRVIAEEGTDEEEEREEGIDEEEKEEILCNADVDVDVTSVIANSEDDGSVIDIDIDINDISSLESPTVTDSSVSASVYASADISGNEDIPSPAYIEDSIVEHIDLNIPVNAAVPPVAVNVNVNALSIEDIPLNVRIALVLLYCSTAVFVLSSLIGHIPLLVGAHVFKFMGLPSGNDIYNYSVGFFMTWIITYIVRFLTKEFIRIPDLVALGGILNRWSVFICKLAFLSTIVLTVPPLLMGLWFDFTFVGPFTLPFNETPKYSLLRAWVLGLVFLKVVIRLLMIGPFAGEEFQRIMERLIGHWMNRDFNRLLDIKLIVFSFLAPVIVQLLDYLCIPYFLSRLLGLMCKSYQIKTLLVRFSFVTYFALRMSLIAAAYVYGILKKWHNDIRDSRYLIGTELTNRGGN